MTRLLCLALALFLLIPAFACHAADDTTFDPLFPAKAENGKWGYINNKGEFIIQPQFDSAAGFRGDYAVITVFPEGFIPSEETIEWPDCSGIIDRDGNIILEPVYSFDSGYDGQYYGGKDTGIWYVIQWRVNREDRKEGFFDITSGFFSGLKWYGVYPWVSESHLIPVIDDTYRAGYVDRTTGELVIPCQYDAVDPSNFYGGVASVIPIDQEGNETDECILIDETGAIIPLPEGIHAVRYEGAFDDRIKVRNEEELFGYADIHARVIISPQFIYANSFKNGFAVVQYPESDWGCIDPDGHVMVRGLQADDWSGPEFNNGMYACETGDDEFSLIDITGETVLIFSTENLVKLYPPDENGLCLFATDTSGRDNYWKDRRYGYVDLEGNIVAEPKPSDEDDIVYENGLAYVKYGNRCGYIDTEGREVYFWSVDENFQYE